jgi:DNA-nicking Smr family endonuclease
VERARRPADPLSPEEEAKLFKAAMKGVHPLRSNRHTGPTKRPLRFNLSPLELTDEDAEGLEQLRALVENGEGFRLQYTAEYMAGPDDVGADHVAQALHQGRYAIQDYIDLHGMRVSEAEAALDKFFKRAAATGKQGLLIVHGRGLRSAAAPVLKQKVAHWLTRGPWRRWVVAFASAQAYDGGTGATYVLLRRSPQKKRRG